MIDQLPALNACLNGLSAVLLLLGFASIRRGHRRAHARFMLFALCSSLLFLISYITYHAHTGSTRYEGSARPLYLAILGSHTLLAASLAVLVPMTAVRALKGRFGAHRRIARITLPIWFYVSVTGVVIYLMLYG